MKKNNFDFIALVFTGLLFAFSSSSYADMYETTDNATYTETTELPSYGHVVGTKLTSSLANLTTSWLEIPKSIINVSNESNIFFGLFGGTILGGVNTLGRIGVGITDLITFPLPTKEVVSPTYVWDDFDVETTYSPIFRLQETR